MRGDSRSIRIHCWVMISKGPEMNQDKLVFSANFFASMGPDPWKTGRTYTIPFRSSSANQRKGVVRGFGILRI